MLLGPVYLLLESAQIDASQLWVTLAAHLDTSYDLRLLALTHESMIS